MRNHLRIAASMLVALALAACSQEPTIESAGDSGVSAINGPNLTIVEPACMGDYIWNDANMNGIQDDGEEGLEGVTVKIYECPSDTYMGETTTDETGYYALWVPGADDYYIVVVAPDGMTFSPANQGGDDAKDSDVDSNGVGFCTHLGDGEHEKDMDAGLYRSGDEQKNGCIGDLVWYDTNCNGCQDKDEKVAPGVTVYLLDCEDNVLDTQATDDAGLYCFTGLAAGNYKVKFDLPSGYAFSPRDGDCDETLDSDADENGMTGCIELKEDECNKDVDAGLCVDEEEKKACIGDLVWYDINCNGCQDDGEKAAAGVDVYLLDCQDNVLDMQTTGDDGLYCFVDLEAGDYKIKFSRPDGYVFAPTDGDCDEASDSDADENGMTACITLEEGKCNKDVDAGLCEEEKKEGFGCTPGYWKNHLWRWDETPYSPDMDFDTVFGVDVMDPDLTLWEAINQGGGDGEGDDGDIYERIGRHAVAALLNMSHPDVDYALDFADIVAAINGLNADILEENNELGCPLSGNDPNKETGNKRRGGE